MEAHRLCARPDPRANRSRGRIEHGREPTGAPLMCAAARSPSEAWGSAVAARARAVRPPPRPPLDLARVGEAGRVWFCSPAGRPPSAAHRVLERQRGRISRLEPSLALLPRTRSPRGPNYVDGRNRRSGWCRWRGDQDLRAGSHPEVAAVESWPRANKICSAPCRQGSTARDLSAELAGSSAYAEVTRRPGVELDPCSPSSRCRG